MPALLTGISWTMDKKIAEYFAYTYNRNIATAKMEKTVTERTVPKMDVIAYFQEREEQEVIYISGS